MIEKIIRSEDYYLLSEQSPKFIRKFIASEKGSRFLAHTKNDLEFTLTLKDKIGEVSAIYMCLTYGECGRFDIHHPICWEVVDTLTNLISTNLVEKSEDLEKAYLHLSLGDLVTFREDTDYEQSGENLHFFAVIGLGRDLVLYVESNLSDCFYWRILTITDFRIYIEDVRNGDSLSVYETTMSDVNPRVHFYTFSAYTRIKLSKDIITNFIEMNRDKVGQCPIECSLRRMTGTFEEFF